MNEMVKRFTEKYGEIVGQATNGTDEAQIGIIPSSQSYVVFYPDNTLERFERSNGQISYREGYRGPAFTYREPANQEVEQPKLTRMERKIKAAPRKNTRDVKEVIWERQRALGNIDIPEMLRPFIKRAEKAFREVQNAVGEMKTFDTAQGAFEGILECGYFLNVVSDFTKQDVRDLRDLPERFHEYLGSQYVGPQ